jgi:hypothetical protein
VQQFPFTIHVVLNAVTVTAIHNSTLQHHVSLIFLSITQIRLLSGNASVILMLINYILN